MAKVLVLDAMGVLYTSPDDVAELLVPFIAEYGGIQSFEVIKKLYRQASLGVIHIEEFWRSVGVDARLEDAYLARQTLNPGVLDFLKEMKARGTPVWICSNDVGEWSEKLRKRFDLERFLTGSVISGNIGLRKPDPAIFEYLLQQVQASARDILFIDDRPANLASAATFGMQTLQFGNREGVTNFDDLLRRV